jgi:hypothetical protein
VPTAVQLYDRRATVENPFHAGRVGQGPVMNSEEEHHRVEKLFFFLGELDGGHLGSRIKATRQHCGEITYRSTLYATGSPRGPTPFYQTFSRGVVFLFRSCDWLGVIAAKTEEEAIEIASKEFKVAPNRLIAQPTK